MRAKFGQALHPDLRQFAQSQQLVGCVSAQNKAM
jgi:hypothetical protein